MPSYPKLMPTGGGGGGMVTDPKQTKRKPRITPPEKPDAQTAASAPGSAPGSAPKTGTETPRLAPDPERKTTGPATQAPAYTPPAEGTTVPEINDRIRGVKADRRAIEADTDQIRRRTAEMAERNQADQTRLDETRNIDTQTRDGFAYTPEQREQLGKAGAQFRYNLPDELALKRQRLADPGFIPPSQIEPENTPEEYRATADRLNEQFEGEATFRYDPDTGGMVGVGGPDQQARAEQERQARIERGRADLAEAREKGISIGELREQRREMARAQHEAELAQTRGPAQAQEGGEDPAAQPARAFGERVERATQKYDQALESGGDLKQAGRSVYRAHRDERVGPFAEKPSSQDRAVFANHVSRLMASKGIEVDGKTAKSAAKAKVINEALGEVAMADVRYLLKNPSLANAQELERVYFEDLFANADGVAFKDIKGLGTLIMEAYGVDYKGRRTEPRADDDE